MLRDAACAKAPALACDGITHNAPDFMPRPMSTPLPDEVIGAIDVGTNAVRLKLDRILPDGTLENIHSERVAIRLGEGLFTSGTIKGEVEDRLVATLRRYAALVRRYRARTRAVGTSALRDAKNRAEIIRRVKDEAGLTLEVISGREEARLISLGVLSDKPATARSLCVDIGGGSTEVIYALGAKPTDLWSVDVGSVRITEVFKISGKVDKKQLKLLRAYAREVFADANMHPKDGRISKAIGSSGIIGAVAAFARKGNADFATIEEVSQALEKLSKMDSNERTDKIDPSRADVIVGGAVVLEGMMLELGIRTIAPTERSLRDGLVLDLLRRRRTEPSEASLEEEALNAGRRLGFGEAHARQSASIALTLFDALAKSQQLPVASRNWLMAAALLHDVGHAVNYQRHHRHAQYLIANLDLPGLSDRERDIAAVVARFHRRSPPDPSHEALKPFDQSEVRIIRRLAIILRVADALDRSHQQPVVHVGVKVDARAVRLRLTTRDSVDLELWDLGRERELFRQIMGKPLVVSGVRRTREQRARKES